MNPDNNSSNSESDSDEDGQDSYSERDSPSGERDEDDLDRREDNEERAVNLPSEGSAQNSALEPERAGDSESEEMMVDVAGSELPLTRNDSVSSWSLKLVRI